MALEGEVEGAEALPLFVPSLVSIRIPRPGAATALAPKELRQMANPDDFNSARRTYDAFINMAKWGTIVTVIVVAIVVLLIA